MNHQQETNSVNTVPGSTLLSEKPGEPILQVAPTPVGQKEELRSAVIETIKTCFDPEIPVNIYDLGLIYEIEIDAEKNVFVKMTLTSMMCPVAGTLPPEVEKKIAALPGVKSAKVTVVWEPQWKQEMMSEASRLQLGLM